MREQHLAWRKMKHKIYPIFSVVVDGSLPGLNTKRVQYQMGPFQDSPSSYHFVSIIFGSWKHNEILHPTLVVPRSPRQGEVESRVTCWPLVQRRGERIGVAVVSGSPTLLESSK